MTYQERKSLVIEIHTEVDGNLFPSILEWFHSMYELRQNKVAQHATVSTKSRVHTALAGLLDPEP